MFLHQEMDVGAQCIINNVSVYVHLFCPTALSVAEWDLPVTPWGNGARIQIVGAQIRHLFAGGCVAAGQQLLAVQPIELLGPLIELLLTDTPGGSGAH